MISISTNASRLWRPEILQLLAGRPSYHLTVSVYGATAASYDALVRRRGAFDKFRRGLEAAHQAGLPMNLNLVITQTNDTEVGAMTAMAEELCAAQGPQAVHRLQRRPHVLPRRPTRPRLDLQGRPRPAHRPARRGHPGTPLPGRDRRRAAHPAGRLRRVCRAGHLRHLHAAGPAVPPGQVTPGAVASTEKEGGDHQCPHRQRPGRTRHRSRST